MNKIKDILNGLHNFIMEMQSIENIKNYHKKTDEIIAEALSEIRRIRLEELPKKKKLSKFSPYNDSDYNLAIAEARKNIEEV